MQKFLAAFHLDSPDSLKRAIVLVLGGLAVLFLNPVLVARGLPPVDDVALGAFATLVTGYLLQSGLKSAGVAKVDAASEGEVARIDAFNRTATPGLTGGQAPEPKPTAPVAP